MACMIKGDRVLKIDINGQDIVFDVSTYNGSNLAITAKTEKGEILTDLTVNTDVNFPPDEAVLDVANWPNIENIIKFHQPE